jgi:hypothetical protein
MKEGQQIIFRHPHSKEILCGVVGDLTVAYAFGKNKGFGGRHKIVVSGSGTQKAGYRVIFTAQRK